MAVLEYLNENNKWKKVNAYGVSSVNGQQGDVKVTPESIGAPTRDRVERLNRELQKRLEKVEWKDVTEDFNNSEFGQDEDYINYLLNITEEGKYYIYITWVKIFCEIIRGPEDGINNVWHNIVCYLDDCAQENTLYINKELSFYTNSYPNNTTIQNNLSISPKPTDKFHITNKQYVDSAVASGAYKDITEDVDNSDKRLDDFVASLEPGRYYYFDGDTDHFYYDVSYPGRDAGDYLKTIKKHRYDYETGGEEFYKITRYQGDEAFTILEIYLYHQTDYPVTIESPIQFSNNVKIKTPTENFHPATKKYVDDAIANALATIDNAETLSF